MKRNRKNAGLKRIAAMLLALSIVSSLVLFSTNADSWKVKEQAATEYIYEYTGTHKTPTAVGGETGPSVLDSVIISSAENVTSRTTDIFQYELQNSGDRSDSFLTYCSDLTIAPQTGKLYSRIPIEKIFDLGLDDDNFFYNKAIPGRLRNIMLHSDLYYTNSDGTVDIAALREKLSGETGGAQFDTITAAQVSAATQIAIWRLVNKDVETDDAAAMSDKTVKAYVEYLLSLEEVSADDIASIYLISKTKSAIATDGANKGTYSITFQYKVSGEGVDTDNLADVSFSAVYTPADGSTGSDTAPESVKYEVSEPTADGVYTATISAIPLTSNVVVTLKAEQSNVNSIYLFATKNRNDSQTLVSVINETLPLESVFTIEPPT
ncbi:MAG: Cys-Gln thioester bond-forming surface protein, partial [Oscillospiraceae bacterium]|nr:Cys-Gln thioester bond-forming surface protein [Oscillospiraceae bacterium]